MIPHGATTLNLAMLLDQHVRLRPERTAVVFQQRRLTYAELDARANQIANGLRAIGIKPGDHVALTCPNLPYFPMAYFAILKAGAVVVPLNVMFKPREIAYHLRDSHAVAHLFFEGTKELPMAEWALAARGEAPACEHFVVFPADPRAPASIDGARLLAELMDGQPASFPTHPTAPDDTAVILYTSGTTGQPKGAELTHMNLVTNAIQCFVMQMPLADSKADATNVVLITLPLFHSTAQTAQMNMGIYAGFTLALLPKFEPAAVLETMARERVTLWTGVPTMYWSLLQYAKANAVDVSGVAGHLRVGTSGGAPMPVAVLHAFEQTFGVRILEGYGLSETSPVAAFNHVERPSKPGTVGQPLFGVEIECHDDNDRPVATGERGEVVIRGANIMKGYYGRPDATADAMRGGWFHTGDIGTIDAEGYLAIVDRKKDMILRGGFNVYPRELEEVMMTHPDVALVAVIGVPHERLGEEVKAVVVPRPGVTIDEAALLAWCGEQFAAYKCPRMIEVRDALPLSPTGKILKRELRLDTARSNVE